MDRQARSWLQWLLAVIIVIKGVWAPLKELIDAYPAQSVSSRPLDSVSAYLKRLDPVRTMLSKPEIIGYLADTPFVVTIGNEATSKYYMAQYALVPVLIDSKPNHATLLANFRDQNSMEIRLRQNRLIPWKDFGGGLALVKNPYE